MCNSASARFSLTVALALGVLATVPALAQSGAQSATQSGKFPGIGRAATPAEVRAWDIDVRPDFTGLPPGAGSVAKGQQVWDAKCASCHGVFGESNEFFTPVVGGVTADDIKRGRVDALVHKPEIQRTTLMKLSSIATLWDYINRAMPWNAPKTLSVEEVYAVTAYILNLGEILPDGFVLSDKNIGEVQQRVPNRNGMTRNHGLWDIKGRPDVKNTLCMKDCAAGGEAAARVVSAIPEYARDAHGDLAAQNRVIGPVRGVVTARNTPAGTAVALADAKVLAGSNNCMACHAVDKKIVGPSFSEIASRYKGDGNAQSRLEVKIKEGGAGTWGNIPMPPHPEMKQADIQVLVRWVLAGGAPN